MSVLWVT